MEREKTRPRLRAAPVQPALAAAVAAIVLAQAWAPGSTARAGGLEALLAPASRPAPGIGGDPFPSPLEDGAGWWARPSLAGDPGAIVRLSGADPLGAGRGVGWTGQELSVESATRTRVAGNPMTVALAVSGPRWSGAWSTGGARASVGGEGARGQLAARVRAAAPRLTLQVAGPTWGGSGAHGPDAGAGLRWLPGEQIALQGHWSRASAPEPLNCSVADQSVTVGLNAAQEQMDLRARIGPAQGLHAEGSFGRAVLEPLLARSAALPWQLIPGGEGTGHELGLAWTPARRSGLLVRHVARRIRIHADATRDGSRFGELASGAAGLTSWLAGWQSGAARRARVVADVEAVRADARAVGTIETWPFTSGVVDLLGLRRNARAQAGLAWERAHAGLDRPGDRGGGFRAGVTWIDARIEGAFTSWQPVLLGMGATDIRSGTLGIDRAQLIVLAAGGTLRAGRVELRGDVEQLVPLRTWRHEATASAAGSSGEPAPAAPAGRGWPGGTAVEISARLGFGGFE